MNAFRKDGQWVLDHGPRVSSPKRFSKCLVPRTDPYLDVSIAGYVGNQSSTIVPGMEVGVTARMISIWRAVREVDLEGKGSTVMA